MVPAYRIEALFGMIGFEPARMRALGKTGTDGGKTGTDGTFS